MFAVVTMLAQNAPGASPKGGPPIMLFGLIVLMVVFFFVMMRGNRSQQKKKENMLNAMQKNDRVMTIGGVIGTIVQVKESEVVLKVDEASNTKMTFIKRAIQQVISEDDDLTAANRETR
ncbi:MAG: preprotein translocase subunit YajC [Phycisphaerae bacterium]|nr:preprotein translocase subunit YajC [Phycisphaerae bacterium]